MEEKIKIEIKKLENTINNSDINSNEMFEISKKIDELVIEALNKKLN